MVEADDNIFYTSKAPGSSNSATYLIAIEAGAFAGSGSTTLGQFSGGNNQIGESASIGSNTTCGITESGWAACYAYPTALLDSGASLILTNFASKTAAAVFPGGVGSDVPFALQAGSSAIGAASSLPAAIASNTLGMDFTPTLNYGGTTRTNLNDLGATQSGVGSGISLSLLPGTALTPGTEIR